MRDKTEAFKTIKSLSWMLFIIFKSKNQYFSAQ